MAFENLFHDFILYLFYSFSMIMKCLQTQEDNKRRRQEEEANRQQQTKDELVRLKSRTNKL